MGRDRAKNGAKSIMTITPSKSTVMKNGTIMEFTNKAIIDLSNISIFSPNNLYNFNIVFI
jgi:hypothetical protein